jgi:plastocyanin domain-containing protein
MRYLLLLFFLLLLPQPSFTKEIDSSHAAEIGADGVQRAEVIAGSYYFRPNHIIVKAGVPAELEIRSEALIVPHDFIVKAPDAGIDVSEELTRKPVIVRFTPTKGGRYPFYCGRGLPFQKSHRAKGMEGVLEVIP